MVSKSTTTLTSALILHALAAFATTKNSQVGKVLFNPKTSCIWQILPEDSPAWKDKRQFLFAANLNPNENTIVTEVSGFRAQWWLLREGRSSTNLPGFPKPLIITTELEIISLMSFSKSHSEAEDKVGTEHRSLDSAGACQESHISSKHRSCTLWSP